MCAFHSFLIPTFEIQNSNGIPNKIRMNVICIEQHITWIVSGHSISGRRLRRTFRAHSKSDIFLSKSPSILAKKMMTTTTIITKTGPFSIRRQILTIKKGPMGTMICLLSWLNCKYIGPWLGWLSIALQRTKRRKRAQRWLRAQSTDYYILCLHVDAHRLHIIL